MKVTSSVQNSAGDRVRMWGCRGCDARGRQVNGPWSAVHRARHDAKDATRKGKRARKQHRPRKPKAEVATVSTKPADVLRAIQERIDADRNAPTRASRALLVGLLEQYAEAAIGQPGVAGPKELAHLASVHKTLEATKPDGPTDPITAYGEARALVLNLHGVDGVEQLDSVIDEAWHEGQVANVGTA